VRRIKVIITITTTTMDTTTMDTTTPILAGVNAMAKARNREAIMMEIMMLLEKEAMVTTIPVIEMMERAVNE